MSESQSHQMRLRTTYPSGAEEWDCPNCGRRFIMQWTPKYRRIVLEVGDETVAHSASKGGLKISVSEVRFSDKSAPDLDEKASLQHWKTWLDSEDVDNWWPED